MATDVQKMSPAAVFREVLHRKLQSDYGNILPPPAYVTPFGIKTVDTFLGGGMMSSMGNMFSSTPETGKSTIALQFCGNFLNRYPNSIAVYLDRESTDREQANTDNTNDIEDRINTFDIDRERFMYVPNVATIPEIFAMIHEAIQIKQQVQKKTKEEYFLNIVWDSVAATPCSKIVDTMNPKEIIGFKANELGVFVAKHSAELAMERATFTIIDQVRDNMQIEMPWQKASNEKSIGEFGNVKAATNSKSLQHNIRQWLFLSKGEVLKPSDSYGIDGWVINIFMAKNKLAPSQYSLPVIFDKKWGIIPQWSEYYFLSNMTKTEKKYWKDKLLYPLSITGSSNVRVLSVLDPETGSVLYESNKFNERKFIELYNSDSTFQYWFDKAVDIAVEQRIKVALFRINPKAIELQNNEMHEITPETIGEVVERELQEEQELNSEQQENQEEDYLIPPAKSSGLSYEYDPTGDV